MGKKMNASDEMVSGQVNNVTVDGQANLNVSNFVGSLEHFLCGVIITNDAGIAINYNQLAVELLGGIPLNLKANKWPQQFGLYTQDGTTQFPDFNLPLHAALRGETAEAVEVRRMGPLNHEGKWLSISARPLFLGDGKKLGAVVYLNDITVYKQVELTYQNKLKQVEAASNLQQEISKIGNNPLQTLNLVVSFTAQNIGDGCIAALLNLPADKLRVVAFHHVKPSARKYLYSSLVSQEFGLANAIEQVIHTGEPLLVPSVDQDRLLKATLPNFRKYILDIGVQSFLVVPMKGRNRTLGTLILVRDRDGNPYTVEDQTFMTDIAFRTGQAIDNNYLVSLLRVESSSRRSAEEALEQSEARFQSIFTSTALGIKLLDLDGNILETNPAFQQMTGYSEEELKGKPLSSFWHPADAKFLFQLLENLKTAKLQSIQLEHRLINKDRSTKWASVTFTGIKGNEHGESLGFIVAIAENITERKRIEAEMSRMKSRLQSHVELERLRLAQELHDGPLQDLYSAIYKIENWGSQDIRDTVEKLTDLKQELLAIVQGLRSTAKDLRPPALAEFGLEKAIRSHADEFQESHPEIAMHLSLAHDGKILPEDIRLILFRIYQHSITNTLRHADACDIHVRFSFDAEEARLVIQDNGTGFKVPTSWMELVREGHYGLAGAVERVSLLNGSFTVESTPGDGTTISVAIPITNVGESNTSGSIEE